MAASRRRIQARPVAPARRATSPKTCASAPCEVACYRSSVNFDRRGKLYIYLCGIFLTALLIGDTIGAKLFTVDIPLGVTTLHATLSVGAMWFPITFLLTDVINEFYGSAGARFVTFLGFFMAVLAFLIIVGARMIPAASFSPIDTATFTNVFGNANRIFLASLVAYVIGQLTDITLFHTLKRLTQSRHIWLR